jgi:acyl dehydratase
LPYGRYFEEFKPGETLKHWPGRTITEADNAWFSLLTQNQHPLHIDANYAAQYTQHGQRLVVGTLVFAIAVGQTVADVSGRSIANLEYEKITHDCPVFVGDTIYTTSTILETRLASKGDRGIVYLETVATNQRGETVMTFRRRVLVPTRTHATLGDKGEDKGRDKRT